MLLLGSRVNKVKKEGRGVVPRPSLKSLSCPSRSATYFLPVLNCQTFDCASALPASSFTMVVMVAL